MQKELHVAFLKQDPQTLLGEGVKTLAVVISFPKSLGFKTAPIRG